MIHASGLPIAPQTRRNARARPLTARLMGPVALPVSMFVLTLVLIVAHQGKLLELSFTLMSTLVAFHLYRRYPAHYLGFVCWLFFLTPEVRRFADFFNGSFNPKSPIMLAPLVAAAISGLSALSHHRMLGQRRAMPLVLMMIAEFYGFVMGVVNVGVAPACYTLVGWILPVFVGVHLIVTWHEYPVYHRVLLKTFVYGTFMLGAYGIYQFVSPPPWTVFWMVGSGMGTSEGTPVPFGLRISSTMNSCGPFAITIMSGLLMSLAARGKMRIAGAAVGVPALMFTSVRTAWGGMVIGLIYPLAMLDGRSRLRLLTGVICIVGLLLPLTMIDAVSDRIVTRLQSIENLSNDNSFQARSNFYENFSSFATASIAGKGLGSVGLGSKLNDDPTQVVGSIDSGIVEVCMVMGWPGTLLYATGVFMLILRAFVASLSQKRDRFAMSGVGVALSIFAMMVMSNTLQGEPGMLFVIGVLMPVIGLRYTRHKRDSNPAFAGVAAAANATVATQVRP
jgi:hypothetical protein